MQPAGVYGLWRQLRLDDPAELEAWFRRVLAAIEHWERSTYRRGDGHQKAAARRSRPAVQADFGSTFFAPLIIDETGARAPQDFATVRGAPAGRGVRIGVDAGGTVAVYRAHATAEPELIRDRAWLEDRLEGLGGAGLLDLVAEPDFPSQARRTAGRRRQPAPRAIARTLAYWSLRDAMGSRAAARKILEWEGRLPADAMVRKGAEEQLIAECKQYRDRLGRFEP